MIWGCYSYYEQSDLVFLDGKIDARNMSVHRKEVLAPFSTLTCGTDLVLQLLKAPIHRSVHKNIYLN